MVPDPAWLAERRDRLVGLVITHAHEDHIGAVAHLWPQLRCPIYRDALRRRRAARKLAEAGLLQEVPLVVTQPRGALHARRPSTCEYIRVAHSIPEAQALAIRTRHGIVLHTGDWKLDPDPLIGPRTDEAAFAAARRGRRARHGLRFHQRHGGRPFGQRGRGAAQPGRADPRPRRAAWP